MLLPRTLRFLLPPKSVVLVDAEKPRVFGREDLDAAAKEAYQSGFEEATSRLEQQLLAQRHDMAHLEEKTFRSLESQHQSLIEQLRAAIPDFVMETVRRVLAGLEIDRETVVRLVDETLREVPPGRQALEVVLSPRDLELIRDIENDFREKYPAIEFRTDSEMRPGDCIARTRFGVIDGRIATKLKTVEGFLR